MSPYAILPKNLEETKRLGLLQARHADIDIRDRCSSTAIVRNGRRRLTSAGTVYYCTRAFLPLLRRADKAHIVNTSSVNGVWVGIDAAYSTAKFA